MAVVSMKQLLEAGVHFGHQTRRWNPKSKPYVYDHRSGVSIIDLEKTYAQLEKAAAFIEETVADNKDIMFVGTKRQAQEILREAAAMCGMPFCVNRWLGGTLTTFKTVKQTIKHLKEMEQVIAEGGLEKMSKKEALDFSREIEKLNKSIGGIKEMTSLPDALFVIDVGYHKIAIADANKLGIPVIAVVDTNNSPDGVDYVIQGNDDSGKAVAIYASGIADAVLAGKEDAATGDKEAEEFVEETAPAPAAAQ